jgi:hypothetical protein
MNKKPSSTPSLNSIPPLITQLKKHVISPPINHSNEPHSQPTSSTNVTFDLLLEKEFFLLSNSFPKHYQILIKMMKQFLI